MCRELPGASRQDCWHSDCVPPVLQRAAACCSVLQRVAACCSVLRFVLHLIRSDDTLRKSVKLTNTKFRGRKCVAEYCSVLQCVDVC